MKIRQKDRQKVKRVSLKHIEDLFMNAAKIFDEDSHLADRYVSLAINLSQRTQTRIPSALKRKYCPKCKSYLSSPKNLRVRVQKGRVIYTCKNCKYISRFMLLKKSIDGK